MFNHTACINCSCNSGDSLGSAEGMSHTVMVKSFSSPSKNGQGGQAVDHVVLHAGLVPLERQGLSSRRNVNVKFSSQKISDQMHH